MPFQTRAQVRDLAKHPWLRAQDMPHGKACRISDMVKDYQLSERYRTLANTTKRAYLSALKYFEFFILANGRTLYQHRVNEVNYGTVDYLQRVLAHDFAPATIKSYFTLLYTIWELAIRNGRVDANPWKRPLIRFNNERDITWSPEQVQLAITTAKDMGFHLLALYLLVSYETAQRPWRDLRNLTWKNFTVDERGDTILDFVISKTRTHLLLPLSKQVTEVLNSLPRLSEYIFVNEYGDRLTQQAMNWQYKRVQAKAMLPMVLQIRDLRRSAITEMAMAGATMQEIEAATGWRCSEAVIRRYARLRLVTAKHGLQKRTRLREELAGEARANASDGLPTVPR